MSRREERYRRRDNIRVAVFTVGLVAGLGFLYWYFPT